MTEIQWWKKTCRDKIAEIDDELKCLERRRRQLIAHRNWCAEFEVALTQDATENPNVSLSDEERRLKERFEELKRSQRGKELESLMESTLGIPPPAPDEGQRPPKQDPDRRVPRYEREVDCPRCDGENDE